MIDLLFVAWNRLEFTRASMDALIQNTNWSLVRSVSLYDDGSYDGTYQLLKEKSGLFPVSCTLAQSRHGSPVAVMNEFITSRKPELFAKIDNDVVLPPLWLDESLTVMGNNPRLDLLGIEAMFEIEDEEASRDFTPAAYVGGIGIMRGRAFEGSLPKPDGRFGFTAWQDSETSITKGWIRPSLPVILLDRLPFQPWATLSGGYVAKGWQRVWEPYDASRTKLWDWWTP